jgi:hypothetical protein
LIGVDLQGLGKVLHRESDLRSRLEDFLVTGIGGVPRIVIPVKWVIRVLVPVIFLSVFPDADGAVVFASIQARGMFRAGGQREQTRQER